MLTSLPAPALPAATTGSDTGALSGVAGWAVDVMEALGGFGAGLLIALENLFPPLPSEVILPLAGFTASQGTLGFWEVLLWCTAGSVVGAWALYGLGVALGLRRLRAFFEWLPLSKGEDVDRTIDWFHRHGTASIFFGRMVPLFRSLISIPAGLDRMPLVKFTLLTTAGSAIWNFVLIFAGFQLGENWVVVEDWVGRFSDVIKVLVVILIVWFVVHRVRESRKDKRGGASSPGRENSELADHDVPGDGRIDVVHDAGGGATNRVARTDPSATTASTQVDPAPGTPGTPGAPRHGSTPSGEAPPA